MSTQSRFHEHAAHSTGGESMKHHLQELLTRGKESSCFTSRFNISRASPLGKWIASESDCRCHYRFEQKPGPQLLLGLSSLAECKVTRARWRKLQQPWYSLFFLPLLTLLMTRKMCDGCPNLTNRSISFLLNKNFPSRIHQLASKIVRAKF